MSNFSALLLVPGYWRGRARTRNELAQQLVSQNPINVPDEAVIHFQMAAHYDKVAAELEKR